MYHSLAVAYPITLLLAVPAALLLIRLFVIQHDCAHGSFFASIRTADVVGSILGVFTFTPHLFWKRAHAIHHATAGNLDHRGIGDVDTLTVNEYLGRTRWGRFKYRVYRHPCVLFGVGGAMLFLAKHRWPAIAPVTWTRERRSILWTNVGIAGVVTLMWWLVGLEAFLLVHVPLTLMSCSIGVWLFYVQHQFEPTYWERDERWAFDAAALEGSSYYALPRVLQWFTGSIGLHHIHHLSARIPNYRLQRVLDAYPELERVTRITLWQSLSCASLALWDERTRKLVPFNRVKNAR